MDIPSGDDLDSYMEQNKDNIVYDIDTYKGSSITDDSRLQLPLTNNNATSNNSITPFVNVKIKVQKNVKIKIHKFLYF